MKRILTLLLLIGLLANGMAQVTITDADMPQPGDTLRVSMTNMVPGDYTRTAYDTTWDFSQMSPVTQRVEHFMGMGEIPAEYWFVFIPSIVANLASPGNTNLPVPGFPVTDSYTFYNNSATGFSDVGNASKVNGIPLALKYDVPDLWYPFPLTIGMTWNSASYAGITIPSLAYLSNERERSGFVDGWGTLITPYGTFNTLRVKTELVQKDSISLDSMGIHLPFTRNITQYKWLANGEGIPVLQVNVELNMVSAIYRDIYRPGVNPMSVSLGPDTTINKGQSITLIPQVTNGVPPYRFVWGTFDTTSTLTLVIDSTITTGVAVFDALNNIAFDMITITVKYGQGVAENQPERLRISPNPANGDFAIQLPNNFHDGIVRIVDVAGREIRKQGLRDAKDKIFFSNPDLKPGCYLVILKGNAKSFVGTLLVK